MSKQRILCIFGTRPEAIKFAPVVKALNDNPACETIIGITGQHREMLEQVMRLAGMQADFDLDVMRPNQNLSELTARVLKQMVPFLEEYKPDRVLVQGDTTTAFAAALACFNAGIKVGHIEAGLRSHDLSAPWPEEFNRRTIAMLADMHFAPTDQAAAHLKAEKIPAENIFVTGNTVVDALRYFSQALEQDDAMRSTLQEEFSFLNPEKKLVLVTMHRRENFDGGIESVCNALLEIADRGDVEIFFPVHLNSNVRGPVEKLLSGHDAIHLGEPLDYFHFIYLMNRAYCIISDSGGVQEEAISLKKPLLVVRDTTERGEGVAAGAVKLVGTDPVRIAGEAAILLEDKAAYEEMQQGAELYGNGNAAERIAHYILQQPCSKGEKGEGNTDSSNQIKRVCIMGLGYIGLPTATLIAGSGMQVLGVDKNPHVLETVNRGSIHIVEPDLEELVAAAVADKKLQAFDSAQAADVFIITVPTPITDDKAPDMTYVHAALNEIAEHLQPGNLVIIESTSPVGTTQEASERLAKKRPDLTFPHSHGEQSDIRIAYCPERVLPGHIIMELTYNDRIIGGMTRKCSQMAADFYRRFVRGSCHEATHDTAELVKLSENASRDVSIAFANELSNVCNHHDIDVSRVISLANLHPRVNILTPGPGVGGHCIPIDPWFIVNRAPDATPLIQTARGINDARPAQAAELVLREAAKIKAAKIACLGLAYKPNVDDLRESPAMEIVEHLAKAYSGDLLVAEPYITSLPVSLQHHVSITFTSALNAVQQADIVVALVNHRSFDCIDQAALEGNTVLDFAGVWRK